MDKWMPALRLTGIGFYIAICIVNWNGFEDTRVCLASLATYAPDARIYLLENGSGEADLLRRIIDSRTTLLVEERNLGFPAGCNLLMRRAMDDGAAAILLLVPSDSGAIPAFARKHGFNCNMCHTAYPKLPPIKISKIGKHTIYRYVCLMHDHVAYDLAVNDPVYQQVAREADKRGDDNKLFSGAMLDWFDAESENSWARDSLS
jgi:hypothetical protein